MFAPTHRAACLVVLACLTACSKSTKDDGTAVPSETSSATSSREAIVEAFTNATIAWTIGQDGRIRADVADNDGKSISKGANGTVEWRSEAGEPKSAKLAFDEGTKSLLAIGPAPTRDVTEVKYEITTAPGPLVGTLHIPVGGTAALAADSKTAEAMTPTAAAAHPSAVEATGPHGGVVQAVGNDRVEIAAEDDGDEVRVYVLDAGGKSIAVGERKVTLAVSGDANDVIVLVPSSDGLFLVGKWKLRSDPSRVTVVLRNGGTTRVAIVGWKPGAKLVVVGGPKIKIRGKGKFNRGVEVKGDNHQGDAPVMKLDPKKEDDDKGNKGNNGDHGDHGDHGNHGNGNGKGGGKGK